jgi:hypothetical protein
MTVDARNDAILIVVSRVVIESAKITFIIKLAPLFLRLARFHASEF